MLSLSNNEISCSHYLIKGSKWTHKERENTLFSSVQFSRSVVFDSANPWITARQASLSIPNSRSSLNLMSIKSVMPSNHLILCLPLLLLPPIPPSIRVILLAVNVKRNSLCKCFFFKQCNGHAFNSSITKYWTDFSFTHFLCLSTIKTINIMQNQILWGNLCEIKIIL